jgi:hypothetical protein
MPTRSMIGCKRKKTIFLFSTIIAGEGTMLVQEKIIELRNGFKATLDKTHQSQAQLKPKIDAMQQINLELLVQEQSLQCYLELVFNEFDIIEQLETMEPSQRGENFSQRCEQALAKALSVGVDSKITYYAARTHNEVLDVGVLRQQIHNELAPKSCLRNQLQFTDNALDELKAKLLAILDQERGRLEELVDKRIELMTEVSKFQETEAWLHQLDKKYVEAISKYITTPQAGCELGNLEMVKNYVTQAKNNANHELASELLVIASLYGHEDIVGYLLTQGADPKYQDTYKYSAWHRASQNGNLAILAMFLQAEKNAKTTSSKKKQASSQNAFHIFSKKKSSQSVRSEGIDSSSGINLKGAAARTPTHVAAYYDQLEALRWLHKHDANMKEVDAYGKNLLHIAAEQGHVDLIRPLLDEFGVDPSAKTNAQGRCETPLLTAALASGNDGRHIKILIDFADRNYNLQAEHLQGLKQHEFDKIKKILIQVNEQRLANMEESYNQAREEATMRNTGPSKINLQPNYF